MQAIRQVRQHDEWRKGYFALSHARQGADVSEWRGRLGAHLSRLILRQPYRARQFLPFGLATKKR